MLMNLSCELLFHFRFLALCLQPSACLESGKKKKEKQHGGIKGCSQNLLAFNWVSLSFVT